VLIWKAGNLEGCGPVILSGEARYRLDGRKLPHAL
jgi:hypothetical protein